MSIRLKMKLSLLAMIIVPLLLFTVLSLMLMPFFWEKLPALQGYEANKKRENYLWHLSGELNYVSANHPDRFLDQTYTDAIVKRMEEWSSGLLLISDGELLLKPKWLQDTELDKRWLDMDPNKSQNVKIGAVQYEAYKQELVFHNGKTGELIMLMRFEPLPVYLRPLIWLTFLGIIMFTHLVISYVVSRNLVRPLNELKNAAERIKDGNLNFIVKTKSNDEIGELGTVFEEMRQRLEQSINQNLMYEENRKELISNISHDLKTPITAIKGYVEGIMDGVASTEAMRTRYITTIYRKASEMDKLIDELFLLSKLDLNMEPYNFQTCDLESYLLDYTEERQFDMEKAGVELYFVNKAKGPVYVEADREKLSRVLSNIIDNSLKYMTQGRAPSGNNITVAMFELKSEAAVEIIDTGPGIAKEALPHIFNRFYRAEHSRNSDHGGSGLGLSIVKHIVERHGGRVNATSIEGEGSRISFTLRKAASERMGE
ncbi:sensor histidine kinase [Paenibacillaceae bacterium]|nr:sensor histidine kinase [Paenibacillaceae bacterium]